MELFQTLSRQDCESSSDDISSAEGSPIHSRYSSTPLTDGTGTSPKSGTTTSISSFERNLKRSLPGRDGDGAPYHRRTENCPTWQSLPSETRWSFIWGLINPGENPPDPDFYNGVGYEHNTTRRPCKQQSRPRGADICDALLRDIEERDKKRMSLETELEAEKERNAQLEQKHKKKFSSLENIIETLLERLEENNVKVPNSLQKRLQEECPDVFCEPVAQLISKRSQAPPTPSSMFKDGTGELRQSQLDQPSTTPLLPPFSSAGPGDGYTQPFDFNLSGELFANFNYTDGVLVDPSQHLPGGMA
ncbi:hypothetical protein FDENT_11873 [Fusarium denticulatum]|uniref:Uncharacterized protein n=1 Tax=Fusarium denticulatum TaxID=48507 RepID=A0A8H5TGU2_9HYPO|nr:hypothetical protein FDENT_11873 [Fusarium denticulatum]